MGKITNFHVRRLASEGSRPKLPWSTKLGAFADTPEPVFKILENLREDDGKFVQKSVVNNLTDYLKVKKPGDFVACPSFIVEPLPPLRFVAGNRVSMANHTAS